MTLYRHIGKDCLKSGDQYLAGYFRIVDAPVLQLVTVEAMAELKDQETPFILFCHKEEPAFRFERAEYSKLAFMWLNAEGYEINPFDWQWFIVPSAIPENTT